MNVRHGTCHTGQFHVDHQIGTGKIQSPGRYIGRHNDTNVFRLELVQCLVAYGLLGRDEGMQCDIGYPHLFQQFTDQRGAFARRDE